MCLLPQDERHLSRALTLAREAAAFASPNPTVGCVLAQDALILGEAAHFYDRRDHAEIVALRQAQATGRNVAGATAYVTLEPCSHSGRTGPCANALIAAGIRRCVIATIDPNPRVRGNGIARLRAAGIEVCVLAPAERIAKQARELNDAFAFAIQHARPFVTLKAALSIDGKLAPAPQHRDKAAPFWLTGEAARADVQQLRHASDALLTGIGTVLADDPSLTDRTGLPRRRPLLRVVLDSQLRTPVDSKLVRSATRNRAYNESLPGDLLLLANASAPRENVFALEARGVEVLHIPGDDNRLDLRAALNALHARDILGILVEGGSTFNGALLDAGFADKLILYFAETELGADAVPFAAGIASPYALQQQLHGTDRRSFPHNAGEDVRLSGYLHDPWAGVP